MTEDWFDKSIKTDPLGFSWEKMSWVMYPALPFRRIVFAKWYAPVLRVGRKGGEEHVLDLKPVPPGQAVSYDAKFKPRSDGEVFIFVNDAVGACQEFPGSCTRITEAARRFPSSI